jgi:hypothetical protein
MKRIIALYISLFFAYPLASIAAEPAWWTQKKQECGVSMAYETWVQKGMPCNKGGSSSGGSTPAGSLGTALGTALGNAIANSLKTDPAEEARRKAAEEALAEDRRRTEEERFRVEEERKNKLLETMMSVGESPQLGLMGVDSGPGLSLMTGDQAVSASASLDKSNQDDNKSGSQSKSVGYTKGFEDASQCFSQNSGARCAGMDANQQQTCLSDYRLGYAAGDKQRVLVMNEAFASGEYAGKTGELANGASDPRADGPCRLQWIETYNRGHFQGKQAKTRK